MVCSWRLWAEGINVMNDEIEPAVLPGRVMPEGASMQGFAEALVDQPELPMST